MTQSTEPVSTATPVPDCCAPGRAAFAPPAATAAQLAERNSAARRRSPASATSGPR